MSLKIYLDESAYSKRLFNLLCKAGHQVQEPTPGQSDVDIFEYATKNGFVLLTKDADDFEKLHNQHRGHFGVLAIYQNNDPTRDMSSEDIVSAIANIEANRVKLEGKFIVLNQWESKR